MKEIINIITTVSGLAFIASLFAMSAYLYRAKIYTAWQLRTTFMWPKIIFEYRDHTTKYTGKKGIWYNICKVSFFLLVVTFIASVVPQLLLLPTAIAIVVLIAAVTLIPAIGYAIYGLSKEKYF
jgi:hypothetical protein